MTYRGWLSFAGNEIANEARTRAYVQHIIPGLEMPQWQCRPDVMDLAEVLEDKPYTTPLIDDAPWFDPDNTDTAGFCGFLPLSVTGLTDSTREATLVESTSDGGMFTGSRKATREVRVSGLLIGETPGAVEAGKAWLSKALDGSNCDPCESADLCFLAAFPDLDEALGDYVYEDFDLKQIDGPYGMWNVSKTAATFQSNDPGQRIWTPNAPFPLPCDEILYYWTVKGAAGTVIRLHAVGDTGDIRSYTKTLTGGEDEFYISDKAASERHSRGALSIVSGETEDVYSYVTNPNFKTANGTVEVRRNLAPNPSLETGTANWAFVAGTGGTAAATRPTTGGQVGTAFHRVTWSVATTAVGGGFYASGNPVTAGKTYSASVYARSSIAQRLYAAIEWKDSVGAAISTVNGTASVVTANTWTRLSVAGQVAPANAASCVVTVYAQVGTGGVVWPVNATLDGDALLVEEAGAVMSYFDGTTAAADGLTYSWTGTAHASASIATGTAIKNIGVNAGLVAWRGADGASARALLKVGTAVSIWQNITASTAAVVAPGEALSSGFFVASADAGTSASASVDWFNATPTYLSAGGGTVTNLSAGGVWVKAENKVAPASSARAGAGITLRGVPGNTFTITMSGLVKGTTFTYFNGTTADTAAYDYSWSGTADDSFPRRNALQNSITVLSARMKYRSEPDADVCFNKYLRQLREVRCIGGPTTTSEYEPVEGAMEMVEFSFASAVPWVYGYERKIMSVQGPTVNYSHPNATAYNMDRTIPLCPNPKKTKLVVDPDCPQIPVPPRKAVPLSSCGTEPDWYEPYAIYIPQDAVSLWGEAVPILNIKAGPTAVRKARVRFLPRPLPNQKPEDLDPCSACGSFVIDYIPPNSQFILNGMDERATIIQPGDKKSSGSHLLSGMSNDQLFEWPVLTCGTGYYVIIDSAAKTLGGLALNIVMRE